MSRVFVSWSGGKDSSLACYRAIKSGLEVRCLANMVHEDGQTSWSHGISAEMLRLQARGMGLPLVQTRTTAADYEAEFVRMLSAFKKEGITGGVFGDIDFNPHREWIERVCAKGGIAPHLPLWGEPQEEVLKDFIGAGFSSTVITTKADILGGEWLGRLINEEFLQELKGLANITLCGEAGEYHTLVTDGPLFQKRLEIVQSQRVLKDGYWFLEIGKADLRDK
ncbi:MAG: diphthine--ammonia ligase [Chloroflexota bacterium]